MKAKKDFYSNGRGDRLINPLFYPRAIKSFLADEQRMLELLSGSLDLLIEVGCMHGRYLDWAIKHKKAYVGIDVVKRYIDAGTQRVDELKVSRDRYRFISGCAENIAMIVKPSELGVGIERCLALFPFNSFGNMSKPNLVIRSLAESSLPFFISSYRTSREATKCREKYYRNCGYLDIRTLVGRNGVRFTSPDGLNTIAYDATFVREMFAANNVDVRLLPFSQIGMSYLSTKLFAEVKK